MASLSLGIRRSKPNADGSFNIKVVVSANSTTTYIATPYNVDSLGQWRNGRVVRRADSDLLNRRLTQMLTQYQDVVLANPMSYAMTAKQLRDYIKRKVTQTEFVKDFVEGYIARLTENGQTSYANNMSYTLRYLLEFFGEEVTFNEINAAKIEDWEKFLRGRGDSPTTINIRMTHLKAVLNAAVDDEVVEYKVFPFRKYRMPQKTVRDLCLEQEDLLRIRDAVFSGVSARRMEVARDLFMLSFYCGGINLTDMVDADWRGDVLTFVRKKTAKSKQGEKRVSISVQPEARVLADKYMTEDGTLDCGYKFSDYAQFRSFVTKSLNRLGETLGLEKRLMFYSARKTFCQVGFELGLPLYVLEYAIGHTIKDANNRPIFDYIKMMRAQADHAIRMIIDRVCMEEKTEVV